MDENFNKPKICLSFTKCNVWYLALAFFQNLLTFSNTNAQTIFYQDVFHGSLTSYGISSWDTTQIFLNNNGGNVKQAFLVSGQQNDDELEFSNYQKSVFVNGEEYFFNNETQVSKKFFSPYLQDSESVHVLDVTSSLSLGANEFITSLMTFPVNENGNQRFYGMSLFVICENLIQKRQVFSLWLNDAHITRQVDYSFEDLMPIDSLKDVAYSFATGHFMGSSSSLKDGSYLSINNDSVGLAYGPLEYNVTTTGTISGQYTYLNDTIFPIGDDSNSYFINGSDCLSNLKNRISHHTTALESSFLYENPNPNHVGNLTNPIWCNYLSYSTPCDTFFVSVPNQMTVCRGDTASINIVGGNAWEWTPQIGLSCYNCANPTVTADSNLYYRVRVWNTDSCSKVLPVKINILEPPVINNITTWDTPCSDSIGHFLIEDNVYPFVSYELNDTLTQPYNHFYFLPEGYYNLTITDTNSCSTDTSININKYIDVVASFNANPLEGELPLSVDFSNTSSGADQYIWYIEQDTLYDENITFLFENEGEFPVTLVAIDKYLPCSNTAEVKIIVSTSFSFFGPTLVSQNEEEYRVSIYGASSFIYSLYNDIGQQIYSTSNELHGNGEFSLWSPNRLSKGIYLFEINLKNPDNVEQNITGKVVIH